MILKEIFRTDATYGCIVFIKRKYFLLSSFIKRYIKCQENVLFLSICRVV